MDDHTRDAVGVDISKEHLDVHRYSTGQTSRFSNNAAGFAELACWVGTSAQRVVYESTGPWHRALEETLAGELPLVQVNALRARRFAQAMGTEAKTDAVDACVLATMGVSLKLRRVSPRTVALRDLDDLVTARDALIRERTAAMNRRQHARHPLLKQQLTQRLAQSRRQVTALDKQIAKTIAADAALTRRAEVLTSIAGVGAVVAAGLLADVPELGHLDGKAAGSLLGVAPWTRESGKWKGYSFIGGGRARPRKLVYMAAVTAIRCNPDMTRKYKQLRARGKPPKVALTAIMRKLIVLANALLKHNRLWTPNPQPAHG